VLGVRPAGKHCFEAKDRVITWCVGHLVELEEPAAYDGRWKAWRLDTLPMIPSEFRLRPVPGTREQLHQVCRLLGDKRFTEVVNACRRGPRGRAHLSLRLPAGRQPAAHPAALDLLADRRGHSTGLLKRSNLGPIGEAGRRRALPVRGGLAGGAERHPRW